MLDIELLEQSFEKIKPRADEFAASFYENLFVAYPEVKPLFAKTDMQKQEKKLLNSLVLVVESLRNTEALGQVLNALGARHIGYGAIPVYYSAVGEALLTTFEQYLEKDWTPEVKLAWSDAFAAISEQMLKANRAEFPEEDLVKTPNKNKLIKEEETKQIESSAILSEEDNSSNIKELPVELLEKSFEQIKPHSDEFAATFYKNLFEAHPEIKPLFAKTEMLNQHKKLINSLVVVVESFRDPEALAQVLNVLGARHIGYGAIPKYYPAVGQALFTSFEEYLGEEWTEEVKEAWGDAFRLITAQMLKGAREISAAAVREQKPIESKIELKEELKEVEVSKEKPVLFSFEFNKEEILNQITENFQEIKEVISQQPWGKTIKQLPGKLNATFWILPAWAVALIAAVVMSAIYVISDEGTWLGEVLNGADAISLVVAVVLFIKEAPDRRKQFHYQAWSTIDAAHNVKVSYARLLAMQDLNEDGVSLRGLDVQGAELVKINLPKANLSEVNLSETDLSNANLKEANLNNANLSLAKLSGANLAEADLSFARLIEVNLSSANLKGANLICADLSRANLSGVNLRNASLSGAIWEGTYLTGANLKDAKVSVSELKGAFLEGAIMPDGSKYQT
ncbi:MAG TPA: globin domain-containing protein [Halomicronema sp.]